MDILFLLIPLSLVLVSVVGMFLIWAVDNGQFEDLESLGEAVLQDKD